jgi:hypothetical protein
MKKYSHRAKLKQALKPLMLDSTNFKLQNLMARRESCERIWYERFLASLKKESQSYVITARADET